MSVSGLVTAALEAREDRKLERLLRTIQLQGRPILDELGYVPFTKAEAELLLEVVNWAHKRQRIAVTTNLSFEQWVEVSGAERLTGAMLDRLTHRVHIIEANGESYRLRDRQRRMRRKRRSGRKNGRALMPLTVRGKHTTGWHGFAPPRAMVFLPPLQ